MKVPTQNISHPARARRDRRIHKAIASLLLLATTTSFATPTDYAAAGRAQGSQDSTGEAKRLGRLNGIDDGKKVGYRDGYDDCAQAMRREAQINGQRQGDRDATIRGSDDGSVRGTNDGQAKGADDGQRDGDSRSNQQAYADATPRGTADGIAEANRTDAAARGSVDGKVAGNSAAKADANANEYQPARAQYRKERYAEAIRSESTINLKEPAPTAAASKTINSTVKSTASTTKRGFNDTKSATSSALLQARVDALNLVQSTTVAADRGNGPGDPTIPDVKPTQAAEKAIAYCKANTSTAAVATPSTTSTIMSMTAMAFSNPQPQPSETPRGPGPRPSRTPPSPTPTGPAPGPQSEFEKCVDAYKPAYEQAFVATFRTEYVNAYKPAFDQVYGSSKSQGCQEARRADYRRDYDDAYRRSYDETYRLVFDRVYRNIYGKVYAETFRIASADAYDRTYQGHYATHYANAKAKAFQRRQDELYTGAFNIAKAAEYAARYPGYKTEVVARGRADEAAEFTRIPVRLTGIAMKESIKDGVQEPGEMLTVDMDLRNFSDAPITANDLDIRAVAKTSGVAIPGSVAILTKSLAAKSLTHVVGALDIRLDESALGKDAAVVIQISVRGNPVAAETIHLTAKTLTSLTLLETPVVRLGYPGAVRVRVTNQSSLALPEDATLGLTTNMNGVVFTKTSDSVNGLGAGEARDITFPFNADNYQEGQQVTFVAALNLASGRRVGILNESRQVPSLQDYAFRISNGVLLGDISDLKKSGKTRIKVYVKNISSRQATSSLTLTASITGPNAGNFSFVKGNQIVFSPIAPGVEADGDKIVVKSNKSNSGGTFVLEVREGGKLIGVYKEAF